MVIINCWVYSCEISIKYIEYTTKKLFDIIIRVFFMHTPSKEHWAAIKHILRYLEGATSSRLHITRPLSLHGYNQRSSNFPLN
jgi:ppGpp synthetase/RelA/SpoT-type nucleotidyltranferase